MRPEAAHCKRKHDDSLPIVGVNIFRNRQGAVGVAPVELARSSEEEKQSQLRRLRELQARHASERPLALERLRQAALAGGNVFAVLMNAVRCCALGEITHALFAAGGRYRRSM